MEQKTRRGSGELQESVGHGGIIGKPSPPTAFQRSSLSSLVMSPGRPETSNLSETSQRMHLADKLFALRVAKRITLVGCASFSYDAIMDVVVAVSAAHSYKWASFEHIRSSPHISLE